MTKEVCGKVLRETLDRAAERGIELFLKLIKQKTITPEEWFEKVYENQYDPMFAQGYGTSTVDKPYKQKTVLEGFFKWNDLETGHWAGTFVGDYVYFTVEDHRKNIDNESLISMMTEYYVHEVLRINWPDPNKKILTDIFGEERYKSLRFLTMEEYENVCAHAGQEWKKQHEERCLQNFYRDGVFCYPSVEFPYFLHLSGNNDTSYGQSFKTLRDLLVVLNDIIDGQDWDYIHRHMVYTN